MKIVFFGDSVTEGVFELMNNPQGGFDSVFDKDHVYHKILIEKLKNAYSGVAFEGVNMGVAGDSSKDGLERVDKVLMQKPDLTVVCFGLNDAYMRDEKSYGDNMNAIFKTIKSGGGKCVFLTPNMMNTYVAEGTLPVLYKTAEDCAACQNEGVMDKLVCVGKTCAKENGVYIADAYAEWKKLAYYGVDTTKLLANKINHPTREMHRLFADVLFCAIRDNNLVL